MTRLSNGLTEAGSQLVKWGSSVLSTAHVAWSCGLVGTGA